MYWKSMDKKLVLVSVMISVLVLFVIALIFKDSFTTTGQVIVNETVNTIAIPSINVSLVKPFILQVGQTALIDSDNLEIKLLGITEDSRCPTSVTCIQAGKAIAEVEFIKDGKKAATVKLANINSQNDSNSADLFFYRLKLSDIYPQPVENKTPAASEYSIQLIVNRI